MVKGERLEYNIIQKFIFYINLFEPHFLDFYKKAKMHRHLTYF